MRKVVADFSPIFEYAESWIIAERLSEPSFRIDVGVQSERNAYCDRKSTSGQANAVNPHTTFEDRRASHF